MAICGASEQRGRGRPLLMRCMKPGFGLEIFGPQLATWNSTRPSSLASFFSGMARFAALYFRKKRSHAPGPTTPIVSFVTGATMMAGNLAVCRSAPWARSRPRGAPTASVRPPGRVLQPGGYSSFWLTNTHTNASCIENQVAFASAPPPASVCHIWK